jgi:transposase-like protein
VGRKCELVLRLMRGESTELLSRELGLPMFKLEQWREKAEAALDGALKERDAGPASTELAAAMQCAQEVAVMAAMPPSRRARPWRHAAEAATSAFASTTRSSRSRGGKTEWPECTAQGYRRFRCRECGKQFNERSAGLLNRTQFPSDVIALVVLWRLRYRLTLRDLSEMFLQRGIVFSYKAVREWEAKLAPPLAGELRQRRWGKGGARSRQWHVDETYLKVRGRWCYLYRAIDRDGQLVDTMLSEHRDMAAAQAFFRSAKSATGMTPDQVTTDGHGSYPRAIRSVLGRRVVHRPSTYKDLWPALRTPQGPASIFGCRHRAEAGITLSGTAQERRRRLATAKFEPNQTLAAGPGRRLDQAASLLSDPWLHARRPSSTRATAPG